MSVPLGEGVALYLRSLPVERRRQLEGDVMRFVRWYGPDQPTSEMSGHQVAEYAGTIGSSAADGHARLEAARGFLAYLKGQRLTATNLAVHLKPPRGKSRGAALSRSVRVPKVHAVTAEGRAALKAELAALKAERPRIAEQLRLAMADKDFRENAPLDAARDAQAYLEARIRELEATLGHAVTIERPEGVPSAAAGVGSRVILRNLTSGAELRYQLVSPKEIDVAGGRISVESPVGRALVGRCRGDQVEVQTPSGTLRFRVEKVEG